METCGHAVDLRGRGFCGGLPQQHSPQRSVAERLRRPGVDDRFHRNVADAGRNDEEAARRETGPDVEKVLRQAAARTDDLHYVAVKVDYDPDCSKTCHPEDAVEPVHHGAATDGHSNIVSDDGADAQGVDGHARQLLGPRGAFDLLIAQLARHEAERADERG
jgi:hypothetical protein